MQQRTPAATVHHLIEQASGLKIANRLKTIQRFLNVASKNPHNLSALFFPDVGRSAGSGQISYIGGLLIDDM